jgi:hypothetical protein
VTVIKLRATTALTLFLLSAPALAQTEQQPVIVTPPVGDFSLPPSGQTPSPRPTPSPVPTPTAPQPTPVATATPAPRPTQPRPAATPTATPTPTGTTAPTVTASPQPDAAATPPPPAATAPAVESDLTPTGTAPPAPASDGLPGWLLVVLGGGLLLAAGLGIGWMLGRRNRDAEEPAQLLPPPAAAPPPPPPPTPSPPARVTPPPPPPAPPPEGALVTELRPLRAAIRDGLVTLDFELFVQNRGTESADNIRAVLALMGANAQQDDQLAGFFGSARMAQGSEPFSIAPGGVFMLNGQVTLPDDAMPAVQVQGKAMFVPIVPVALRWYAGLSIKTLRDAFMVGTVPAPGSDKLGPLWVDRAASGFGPLAAKRYVAKPGG